LLANRVHDVLTAVAYAGSREGTKRVHLIGFGGAGPSVLLARALAGDAVVRTAADGKQFRFEDVLSNDDEMMLPGALKYGGLPSFAALCAPGELLLHNPAKDAPIDCLKSAYQAVGVADRLVLEKGKISVEKVVNWLLR